MYELLLDESQAQTLADVLGFIAGSSDKSRRGEMEDVLNQLSIHDVHCTMAPVPDIQLDEDRILFADRD